ncbi:MAG: hypothetical protein HZA53_03050 [Planctomycetes bacterium]|nr:hypothetical protein [Planctomycetota bacterium]
MTHVEDPIDGALLVESVLGSLGIRYFVTGSVASIYYGEFRLTGDADIVVEVPPALAPKLSERLREVFQADDAEIQKAVRSRGTFQLLHVPSFVRLDVFVRERSGYDGVQFDRSREVAYRGQDERLFLCSPEDIVLQKLRWYALSDGASTLQWRDVLGVLKTLRGRLDLAFMREWADTLSIRAELERALVEAGYEEDDVDASR